ncbi:hypothetical protein H8L32_02385 [Undibacterium sp. CY18W]|uniref:Uncharacterized protein n=1 Tax=Undibacterium hunanense TaxID=2762292 RepID=A0ABR6ZK98_9BURK|nr:hypothetical protein [Undibacterium hunanense]MBC3916325.1 hypothetical protein [Undibacterium hunanense]
MSNKPESTVQGNFFDCTIRAGYYNFIGPGIAQHTFAIAKKNDSTYAMPCFGSFALREEERGHRGVVYPAELWSPWIIGSQPQGQELPANLSVALGMAQFKLFPGDDWKVADWDAYWASLDEPFRGYSPQSWAGIIYGVHGVCHQACNRILWASRKGAFNYTPVNWPPSFSASYWAYGFYGSVTESAAAILATALVINALAGDTNEAMDRLKRSEQLTRDIMNHQTRIHLEDHSDGAIRQHQVQAILDRLPQDLQIASPAAVTEIIRLDREFSKAKLKLDNEIILTEDTRHHDDYAANLNRDFANLLLEFRGIMPAETFNTLFPDVPEGSTFTLVERKLMHNNYRQLVD